ncbi:PREDICTED: uncharacterized protein LOC105451917 [Wasmannia auropunctata]|uniref:uncharacterized protein LOC105451917 n=1 Tax=Wasmannia auropunctata TaxID=64793 RepID=UPI0005F07546|nr:PREDICTED: uncharacterized protein LOC105451917 [Wasmannia auropunctata]
MRLYAVALIAWAAFITASSEHNISLNDEKAADHTESHGVPTKQIVQPYVTDEEAKSSGQTGTEDQSDDFANAGLSRSAVHDDEERGSNDGVSTTDSSSPGSIYATPLSETSIRLETTDEYPFREYPSHAPGDTEDVLLVENAGSFGQKVRQDRPRDRTIVRTRTVVRTSEGVVREDDEYTSFQNTVPFSSTVSSRENGDNDGRPYTSATREPYVFALKKESNLADDDSSSDDSKTIKSEAAAAENSDEIFSEITTENPPPGNIASILENDVVPEILPTPQARLTRAHNDTASGRITEKSAESAKKTESVVRTSTTVEISPSFQARFSGPIIVADLPDRETREMAVDYMDDAYEAYKAIGNAEITSEINAEGTKAAASAITSSVMLNPLQVGITLVNADQARLTDDRERSAGMDTEDYPQDDLQRLATVDKDFVKNNDNQSHSDYQNDGFERDDAVEKRAEVDIQKVPDGSVEIQKSVELYHTAPVHEIHYPPEYIQQTSNLGVIETNNIGNWQRSKQPYDQVEQSELRPTYDIYQGNDQDEKSVIKAHASALPQKLNQHEYNALEDDVGRPVASVVAAEFSTIAHGQTPLKLQQFKYNGMQPVLLAPSQFDDTLYDQSSVRHIFNGNDNGTPPRAKPIGSSTRQETASEPAKPYVPSAYSGQQPQSSSQPHDHQHPFRSPEVRRPEVSQLLLRIIPEGSSPKGGFLVPIPRPYSPIEKIVEKTVHMPHAIEKKVPVPHVVHMQVPVEKQIRLPSHIYPLHIERVIEKRVPYTVQRLVVQPPSYPLHVRLPAAYPAYPAAPTIEQPAAHATVPIEKATEKPAAAVSSRPSRPYRANTDRPLESGGGGGSTETRFTKYYQKPLESIFAGGNANFHGTASGLTFAPQSEANVSQFYSVPYSRPSAYDYNVDVGKTTFIPAAHFSNVKLVILPKKFGSHMILRPHTATPSYAIPSFGRQILYNLVEKDKSAKDEYVGPTPPRKTSQGKVFPQTKSPQFSTSSQSLANLRKSRQPEAQHRGNFRQSKMEYGFKPPMVPSIQYDENTASKVEN